MQTLAYEIFKVRYSIAPKITTAFYPQKSNYNLKNSTKWESRITKTILYDSETVSISE